MANELTQGQIALIEQLRSSGVLTQPAVIAAFQAVPRHLFLPGVPADEVYRDQAIPTKTEAGRAISSSSQPAMMAIMLEQLNVLPGQNVLEIGAGTGYNAALLGWLAGPNGHVVTVDIDPDIVAAAQDHLAAASSANVQVICGDGADGYLPSAPYDRIVLTVGADDIAHAWYDQLRPGGRLLLPLRLATGPQVSVALDKLLPEFELRFISRSVRPCAFMPLRGANAGPDVFTTPRPGVMLATEGLPPAADSEIEAWLTATSSRVRSHVRVTEFEAFGSLSLWLGLHTRDLVSFNVEGDEASDGRWPFLFRFVAHVPMANSIGLISADGFALLDHDSGVTSRASDHAADEQEPFELIVVGFGPGKDGVVARMLKLLQSWEAAQRPSSSRLRLRVFGPEAPCQAMPDEVLLEKRCSKLMVDWPNNPVSEL